jgi:L,D-transpeptidase YcbB
MTLQPFVMKILTSLRKQFCWLPLLGLLLPVAVLCQPMSQTVLEKYKHWPRFGALSRFYELNHGNFAWLGKNDVQGEILQLLHLSSSLGLREVDYQGDYFSHFKREEGILTNADSVDRDIRFTDAAIHFFSEVKNGNAPPSFRYDGLRYSPGMATLIPEIVAHINKGKLRELLVQLQPASGEYARALGRLKEWRETITQPGFRDVQVTSVKTDSTNKALLLRLKQLGVTDTVNFALPKREVVQKIKLAQREFDLHDDGVVGRATLNALNVPLTHRVEALKTFLNTLRWLEQLKNSSSVLVLNLAAANFLLYENGELRLSSKVIVGKPSTPTPTLTSTITEVILYPYWTVPHKIATKELLPKIRRNIGFLESGNYQVLNREGRVLDPYGINWGALSRGYFPYVIRQCTGCDNALGIVKFNFYNPFTVYLHDTPTKALFSSDRRYYSHGCMRVEKPVELAHFVLGFNRIAIDTITAKGCLQQQAPLPVRVEKRLPVIVLYSTVWYNKDGELRFYEDVYNKLTGIAAERSAFRQKEESQAD